jgi:ABC-type transporter Mla maintaining outer membrane lipid asymmetry ATPase subunit MlaF
MSCVELRKVTLEVGGKCYLQEADLTVQAGETVVIAGLPEAGKSFVPRLLLGLPGMDNDEVSLQGEVLVSEANVAALSTLDLQALRRCIGTVMRDGGLIENMDIRANVMLPLTYHYRDLLGAEKIQARCAAVLADLQLGHLAASGMRPVALTRHERIYVSLARALVTEPFLLLLDEPCVGLSPGAAQRLCEFIFNYQPVFEEPLPNHTGDRSAGLTRIATTVDFGAYLNFADRFVLMWNGKLENLGDRSAVLTSSDPRVHKLLNPEIAEVAVG